MTATEPNQIWMPLQIERICLTKQQVREARINATLQRQRTSADRNRDAGLTREEAFIADLVTDPCQSGPLGKTHKGALPDKIVLKPDIQTMTTDHIEAISRYCADMPGHVNRIPQDIIIAVCLSLRTLNPEFEEVFSQPIREGTPLSQDDPRSALQRAMMSRDPIPVLEPGKPKRLVKVQARHRYWFGLRAAISLLEREAAENGWGDLMPRQVAEIRRHIEDGKWNLRVVLNKQALLQQWQRLEDLCAMRPGAEEPEPEPKKKRATKG